MIEAPKRSVTRFFVPLVDIMMLLFSMFLLLPILEVGGQGSAEKAAKKNQEELEQSLTSANQQVHQLIAEVTKLRKSADPERDLQQLYKELDELKKAKGDAMKKMLLVQVTRWNGKKSKWEYFDEKKPNAKPKEIGSAKDAKELLKAHQHQASLMGKELQYLQVFPFGGPGPSETKQFDDWFAGAWIVPVVLPPEPAQAATGTGA